MTQGMNINDILEEIEFHHQMVRAGTRRLRALQIIKMEQGNTTEPKVLTEIEDLQHDIQRHKRQIESLHEQSNLINFGIPVPICLSDKSVCTIHSNDSKPVIDFRNGINKQDWSGVAFKFTPKLDVREYTHLDISGTSTKKFTLCIQYKARVGGILKTVTEPIYETFPATTQVLTIKMPLKHYEAVDEIVLMFYTPGEESIVTIDSIHLSK